MYGLNMSDNDKSALQKAQADIESKDAGTSAAGYASQAEILRDNGIVVPTGNAGANVVPGTPLPASWSGGGAGSYAGAAGRQAKSSADVDALKSLYAPNGGYSQAALAMISANNAGVQRAVNDLQAQKTQTEQNYSDLFRQLYRQKKNAQKNIGQQMAAQGVTGGGAESTMLGLETGYSEALRLGQQERIDAQNELDRAITDARLTGDIQNAQIAADNIRDRTNSYAGVLQSLINRQDNWDMHDDTMGYTRERDAVEDGRYADQQKDADKADARTRVENMILSYGMKAADIPDVLRELAGFTAEELAGMESYYAAQAAAAAKGKTGNNYTSKPKLTAAQTLQALEKGIVNDETLAAYRYYYGQDWEVEEPTVQQIGGVDVGTYDQMGGNYIDVKTHLEGLKKAGKSNAEIRAAIVDAYESGVLNQSDYMRLYGQYR